MAEFLLEIGTEEIPARMLRKAEADLIAAFENLLREQNLAFEPMEAYGAPRQLVLFSRDVALRQEDREETIAGPPVSIAYDQDGQPSRALQGFLKKNPNLSVDDLFRMPGKKGEVVAGKVFVTGRQTIELLAEAIPTILAKLHFPKAMRWGRCTTRFVRPVRRLTALFDGQVIPFSFAGMTSDKNSFGHRFSGAASFPVSSIDGFLAEKEKQGIVVRHKDRKERIADQITAHLGEIGGTLVPDEDLLAEVADLVELPHVVLGAFDPKFLAIPKEVLVTSMRDHQKSFCVQDGEGALMPWFMALASVAGDEKGLIRKGNEWVLNARLWDAKFFWESDCKKDFDALRGKLVNLVFQTKIGNYHEKTERLAALAEKMVAHLAEVPWAGEIERSSTVAAARACKTDLVSDLVFEFPELQGITGGLLLRAAGRPESVAQAVYEHYLPNAMEGDMPTTKMGALVSLADKLDTLVACFAVGLMPTGNKDPYALRRAAQGIVRLLVECELPLPLAHLLDWTVAGIERTVASPPNLRADLDGFFADRMRYYLKREGFEHDLIEAVLATDTDRVDQILKRARAVVAQQERDSFRTLALNHKRMSRVIADELQALGSFNEALLSEAPEVALWQAYKELRDDIEAAGTNRDYNRAMDLMTQLAEPVASYFDSGGVFVNVKEDRIRLNRKSMIRQIGETLGMVADIGRLE